MQALAVSAQFARPCRVGGAGRDQGEPLIDAVRGEVGGQIGVLPGRELSIG